MIKSSREMLEVQKSHCPECNKGFAKTYQHNTYYKMGCVKSSDYYRYWDNKKSHIIPPLRLIQKVKGGLSFSPFKAGIAPGRLVFDRNRAVVSTKYIFFLKKYRKYREYLFMRCSCGNYRYVLLDKK